MMAGVLGPRKNGPWPGILFTSAALLVFHIDLTGALTEPESHKPDKNTPERYRIVSFDFQHVEVPYVICLWILLASVAKIGFHLYDRLPHIFPESCLLITLGILVGLTLYFTETASSQQYSLDANIFFLFLLPPIIYDAGYHMPNKPFFNNMGTIMLLAVVNTLWNTFGIGVSLWSMCYLGWIDRKIGIFNCLVFSALISAVDPVAVLAIFEEIQVNEILYIIVLGESLLNDGVTVVLYRMMDGFTAIGENNVQLADFAAGLAQFFIVILGGTLVGVIYGLMGAFITKYTDHVRVLEPLFIFVLGYLAYLTAEIMGLSSILALTFGGIIMRHYTEANMAKKSTTTVKYFMKMMATISETVIFMFLGLSTVIDSHEFHIDFILFTILFCLIFRVTGVVLLSFIVNQRRLIRLSAIDQFIMSYGGLRGGIAFCLALLLNKHHIPEKAMFVTTTTVIVFFTVFIQGVTIKPVVNALKVARSGGKDPSMNEMIHKRFIDHLMAGVENIVGKSGHNAFQHKFDYYNTKYLKPLLLRERPKGRNPSIVNTFTRLSMQEAKAAVLFQHGLPLRDPIFFQPFSCASPTTNFLSCRRATISVPSSRGHESTVVNLSSSSTDPVFVKNMGSDFTMQHILENSLFEPRRRRWVRERRHTLAEIHDTPVFHQPQLSQVPSKQVSECGQQLSQVPSKQVSECGQQLSQVPSKQERTTDNDVCSDKTVPATVNEKSRFTRTVAFSGLLDAAPSKQKISDLGETVCEQESSCLGVCPISSHTMLSLGMPAPTILPDKVSKSTPQLSSQPYNSPSDPKISKRSKHSPPSSSSSSSSVPHLHTNRDSSSITEANSTPSSNHVPSAKIGEVQRTDPIDIPNCQPRSGSGACRESSCSPDKHESSDSDSDKAAGEGTIAETSLPWRRQTSLPPVPSSISLSLPDEENPLMSEAPSWADNLSYNHLTETGSPYQSPQNTITAKPVVTPPRPVFDIFPPGSPQHDNESAVSSIPPPWTFKDSSFNNINDEPIPSQSVVGCDSGDKASCLLMSSHDLVPPSYHSCLQPVARSMEVNISRRHSEVSSPTHFQFMDKLDSLSVAALESQLIGIEEDYHYGMAERVSQWLANPKNAEAEAVLEDVDGELATREEGQKILESLQQKKERWTSGGEMDDGTDADVESDNDMQDTRL